MKNRLINHFLAIIFSMISMSALATLPPFVNGQPVPSLAPMLKDISPGVVNVFTRGRVRAQQNPYMNDPFFQFFFGQPGSPMERKTQSLGSGVIVDIGKGYILTNHHVIEHADEIAVSLRDGRRFDAKVVGADPESDVAVIQIKAAPNGLTAIPFGDSDSLEVGDFVVAIGNPFGLGQTVTSGIISALGRSGLDIEGYEDFIQTDASINMGNSGGALVNLNGQLVGINTAILSPTGGNVGIGFAIPINMAKSLMNQLVQHGSVRRGLLGVSIQDYTPDLASAFGTASVQGALITQIEPDSAAAKAGLKAGDVIISVDGRAIKGASGLKNTIGLLRPGMVAQLQVNRNGETLTLPTKILEPKEIQVSAKDIHSRLEGAVLVNTKSLPGAHGLPEGVVLVDVEPGSSAWAVGLRKGDVIVSANKQRVLNLNELRKAVKQDNAQLLLNIRRGKDAFFMVIR